jgi:hypothetical protein
LAPQLQKKRPPCRSLDLNDPAEVRLADCLRRISQLLKSPSVAASAEAQSSLGDFLGVVYALIRAKHEKFRDRLGGTIDTKPVAQRAAKIAGGHLQDGWPLDRGLLLQQRAVSHGRRLLPDAQSHHLRERLRAGAAI